MKKKLIYLSFLLGGMSLVMPGCAPELARTNYGPEEQQWKNYVQGCYSTWTPPATPAPYSENNTSTSAVSTIDAVPAASTAETTIPVVAAEEPVVLAPAVITTVASPVLTSTYTIKKGDSLWTVSQKVYGDGKYWKKIFDANKGKLSSSGKVREGMVLTIPAK